MTRLDEIRARLAAATPAPWRTCCESGKGCGGHMVWSEWHQEEPLALTAEPLSAGNAALIAHAPADIAYLIAENERLRGAGWRRGRTTDHEYPQEAPDEETWVLGLYDGAQQSFAMVKYTAGGEWLLNEYPDGTQDTASVPDWWRPLPADRPLASKTPEAAQKATQAAPEAGEDDRLARCRAALERAWEAVPEGSDAALELDGAWVLAACIDRAIAACKMAGSWLSPPRENTPLGRALEEGDSAEVVQGKVAAAWRAATQPSPLDEPPPR